TPASKGEPTVAKKMISHLSEKVLDRAQYLMADRGYSGEPLQDLLEGADILPIIDAPHRWKEEETRQYLDTDIVYNQSG
ncbi:transposase, partial [Streptococcus pyogenes]